VEISHGGWTDSTLDVSLETRGLPLGTVTPWLPFSLPGEWAGSLDARISVHYDRGGWSAFGPAQLDEVHIRGLPLWDRLLDRIAEEADSDGVGFERLEGRWHFAGGELLAESLRADAGALALSGAIRYATEADSLRGVIRVQAPAGRTLEKLLHLIGRSETLLILGFSGSSEVPVVQRLDRKTSEVWMREITGGSSTLRE
jgi:hypothetical protein